jgi:ADP-heptose:LPS heptosyltransferase
MMKALLLLILSITNILWAQEPTGALFLKLIESNGYKPPISEFHTDLMSFLKVNPVNGQDIVILNLNPNIGDNLINTNPLIEHLHQKYPDSKIKFISPTADLINQSNWLEPIKLDLKDFENKKENAKNLNDFFKHVNKTLDTHLDPHSFYISDGSDFEALKQRYFSSEAGYRNAFHQMTVETSEILKSHNSQGVHFYNPLGEEAAYLLNADDAPDYLKKHKGFEKQGNVQKVPFEMDEKIIGRGLKNDYTVYDLSKNHNSFIYGDSFKLNNPKEYYQPSKEVYLQTDDFLKIRFKTEKPQYLVLNFNTAGKSKIEAIEKEYVERVRAMVNKIKLDHPNTKILLTPVESQFGEKIKLEVDAFIKQENLSDIVSYMPEDKKMWGPIIEKSEFVITQDSGFNHIANIYKNPEDILVISSNDAASDWRKAEQLYIDNFKNEKDMKKVFYYMDNELSKTPQKLKQNDLNLSPETRDIKFWSQNQINFKIPHCLVEKLKLMGP